MIVAILDKRRRIRRYLLRLNCSDSGVLPKGMEYNLKSDLIVGDPDPMIFREVEREEFIKGAYNAQH